MKTAIIGLPMVGKTALFTILTGVHEHTRVGNMEARVGVATVPDPRVEALAEVFQPERVTHATVEYLDFPAISLDALKEPGYLASLRLVDAVAHVLRLFQSDTVPHEKGSVDPLRDLNDVEAELILSDLIVVEKRLDRLERERKKIKSPDLDHEFEVLERVKAALESNTPIREMHLPPEQEKRVRGFQFLSQKPMLYVLNIGEDQAGNLHQIEAEYRNGPLAGKAQTGVVAVCGKVEAELAELAPGEALEYLASFGLKESGLERLVTASYALLGLMSFLTAGETEVRAWTIPVNSTAIKAAGAVHTDFEKKFIRAEVVNWKHLVDAGGYAGTRDKGVLKLEGKEYIVKDGDVLVIRHG
jgi:GTP-binding protein YchF